MAGCASGGEGVGWFSAAELISGPDALDPPQEVDCWLTGNMIAHHAQANMEGSQKARSFHVWGRVKQAS